MTAIEIIPVSVCMLALCFAFICFIYEYRQSAKEWKMQENVDCHGHDNGALITHSEARDRAIGTFCGICQGGCSDNRTAPCSRLRKYIEKYDK